MELEGKKVVITGTSSGIGLELTKRLLNEGCVIVAADIRNTHLSSDRLFFMMCDVSLKEGIDRLFDYSIEKMGRIDLFIANAGFAYYEMIDEPDWDHIQRIFATNTMSVIYCAEKMKKLHGKQPYNFLCTASAMSFLSLPGYALYSSTKGALRSFAEAYRYELSEGQYFQLVFPIATRTNFFSTAGDSPVPWPSQSPEIVAQSMIRGLKKDKSNIHPSRIFQLINRLNGYLPFINNIYGGAEDKKFKRWLKMTMKV